MTQMDAKFVGTIPETYDAHLGPLLFEPYAADLVSRLRPPEGPDQGVLEIASGTGILTRRLRQALPKGATLVATDLNEPMLEVARRRLGTAPGIEWRQADAAALPFADESFGAVVCQFGLMFVPDPFQAVCEARRVLVPGGQFLFNVWDSLSENPLGRIAHETIAGFVRTDPPRFYLVPFGLAETKTIEGFLDRVKCEEVRLDTVRLQGEAPSAAHAAQGLVRGNPVLNAIQERGVADPETIIAAVATALATAHGDRPTRVPMQAHFLSALRPKQAGPRRPAGRSRPAAP